MLGYAFFYILHPVETNLFELCYIFVYLVLPYARVS